MQKLNDSGIKALKAQDKPKKYFDEYYGLFLLVTTTGSKLWRQKVKINGKETVFTHGKYPLTTLAQARVKALATASSIEQGQDPRQKAAGSTFAEIAPLWIDFTCAKKTARYKLNMEARFRIHLIPVFGARNIRSIIESELVNLLDRKNRNPLDKDDKGTMAPLIFRDLRLFFRWAKKRGHADNIAADIKFEDWSQGEHKSTKHPYLPIDQLPAFIADFDSRAHPRCSLALRFIALTALRVNEALGLKWADITGDTITIPGDRMKNKNPHTVPLSAQALAVLEQCRNSSEWVFANLSCTAPIDSATLRHIIHKGAFEGQMTMHGWRSIFSNWGHAQGVDFRIVETQLAHLVGTKVERAYRDYDYLMERRGLMVLWGLALIDMTGKK